MTELRHGSEIGKKNVRSPDRTFLDYFSMTTLPSRSRTWAVSPDFS